MDAGESFIWLAAGRLVPAKDFPNLLRAFKQVRTVFQARSSGLQAHSRTQR